MLNLGAPRRVFVTCAFVILSAQNAIAQSLTPPKTQGCPFEISLQQVDSFVAKRVGEIAGTSSQYLEEIQTINAKATKPGVAIGKQLSPQDVNRFNDLTHANILIGVEKLDFDNFRRDVQIISETYKIAKLVDLYELKKEDLGNASPLRFYYSVLEMLRIAQSRVSRTTLISVGIACDPEGGLFWEEELYQNQLQYGADQRLVNLIFDIERLRTFYQLSWNLFNKGVADVKAAKWVGDTPNAPNTIDPYINSAGTAVQNIYKIIIPYIDKQLPSETAFETLFMQRVRQNAERDYPATKK